TNAGGVEHAFLYSNGAMNDLGVFNGFASSRATAINSGGQVVGMSTNPGTYHAVLYSNGGKTDLETLGGFDSLASGINTSGQVVGYASVSGGNSSNGDAGTYHPFVYDNVHGVRDVLPTLPNDGSAGGIDDSGEIVGATYLYTWNGTSWQFVGGAFH